jgi:hypothetical protein
MNIKADGTIEDWNKLSFDKWLKRIGKDEDE